MKKRTVAAALLFTMVMTTSLSTVSGAENVTIKFLHKYCQPEQAPVFEEIVKQYEEAHPGVHIEIETTTDNEIKSKLADMIYGGNLDAKTGLDLLMTAKYFERIGDHAVNIAEWVEYSITGVHRNNEHQNN